MIKVVGLEKAVIAVGGDHKPWRDQQIGFPGNPRQVDRLAASITSGGGRYIHQCHHRRQIMPEHRGSKHFPHLSIDGIRLLIEQGIAMFRQVV